jgi:2,4-dienoyl-CoA reductase-like NADH-dependent reductase (Old Yellow Enzyme family)/thioredoxin reductase
VFLQIAAQGGSDPKGSYAPSAIEIPLYSVPPKELTGDQIKEIIEEFIQAGRRAQEAGFDGAELHGAYGYLIAEFISPYTNLRTDEYGGDFERRMRVPIEIVRGIKKTCGRDFPIGFKFNAYEDVRNGIDQELGVEIAQRMADEGVVYLHEVSMASSILSLAVSKYPSMPPLYHRRNATVPLAQNLKAKVKDAPVIAAGGITNAQEANNIIAEGKADMIALGRALLADPAWGEKAKTGKRIRPCIRCNVCHNEAVFKFQKIICTVNPYLANEREERTIPARKRKRVMVIGGGPAGIVSALVASQRGHEVALYEKQSEIGGLLLPGCVPSFKDEIKELLRYYREEIGDSHVKLELNKEATPDLVRRISPDTLIVSIGAFPIRPDLPGALNQNVITAAEALSNIDKVKGENVVVIGGGTVGCETALYLAQKGKKVTIVESLDELMALEEVKYNTVLLKHMLDNAGVKAYTRSKPIEIGLESVKIANPRGRAQELSADAVVLAVGLKSDTAAVEKLKACCSESYALGDCVRPRRIFEAVHEGDRIGRLP